MIALMIAGGLALVSFYLWQQEKGKRLRLELEWQLNKKALEKLPGLEEERSRLYTEVCVLSEKLIQAEEIEEKLKGMFSTISIEALEKNSRSFLDLAKTSMEKFQEGAKGDLDRRQGAIAESLVPVKEVLQKLDQGLHRIEKERKGEQEGLKEQMRSLQEGGKQLGQETANLVKALRAPRVRGRWGEVQLRRVVELAGMLNQCDFFEQMQGEERSLRPDLIVRLPGGRQVIVDAKVPLESYLEAIHTEDEEKRQEYLQSHARQVRSHVIQLGKKAYWEEFQPTPEFVVLFLPAETFFSAALEADPTLIEFGAEQNVIIATPTTLIALLRAVAYGWKQENLSRQVEKLHELGQELYKRLSDMNGHFSKMGRGLSTAVEAYNKGIGSFESRVLVTARKFKEMGVAPQSIELDEVEPVDKITRELTAIPLLTE